MSFLQKMKFDTRGLWSRLLVELSFDSLSEGGHVCDNDFVFSWKRSQYYP